MTRQPEIDALRQETLPPQGLFIDGTWQEGSEVPLPVTSPIDGHQLTSIAAAGEVDVARAVASARAAFDDGRWSRQPPTARKRVLHRLADLIEREALALAVLGVQDNGTEIGMALKAEPGSAAGSLRYYAEAVDKIYGEIAPTADNVLGLVHREPVGVVGAIVPWNFPLMIGAWKLAPALAAGNSVVLKPAETASLTLLRLAELAVEAGLPPGVLNVVTGAGEVAGQALSMSMSMDVHVLVFADAPDLAQAARVSAAGIFRNSGQVCVAGSRLLVEASVHDDFVAALCAEAEKMRVGDPLQLSSQIGAVNSEAQLRQNLGFVGQALEDGSEIRLGGGRVLPTTGGRYMAPTVVTGVRPEHGLFRNEVFGPVLAVTPFETEAEAVRLANATEYGLAAGVWTGGLDRAHRMVREIRAGVVHVNTYGGADATVPLGGVRRSGNGHDKSLHALDKYTDLKTAWIQL